MSGLSPLRRFVFGMLELVIWSGALLATFGAALLNVTLMSAAGIVAAVAALIWGLGHAVLRDQPSLGSDGDDVPYTTFDHGRMAP
jgi:hypothetical protein